MTWRPWPMLDGRPRRTPDKARETIDSVQASIAANQEMPAAA